MKYLDDLIKRLSAKGIELNNLGQFELRNLVREARDVLEAVRPVQDCMEELISVLLLEYHDVNWLSGNPKMRNENKQRLVGECILRFVRLRSEPANSE